MQGDGWPAPQQEEDKMTNKERAAVERAVHNASQWADCAAAWARADGTWVSVSESHQNGEWGYRATHYEDRHDGWGYQTINMVSFASPARRRGLALKQMASRALNA